MSELKPCPLCGGDAALEGGNETLSEGACWWVQCRDTACFCSIGCHYLSDDGATATEAWNRRAQPAQAGQVLSDEDVAHLWQNFGKSGANSIDSIELTRAIEQAVLAKRVPMTLDQIKPHFQEYMVDDELDFVAGIRAAERHHGIVGEKGGA